MEDKMRITLINPPQYTKYPQPPIGLALLGAWYEKQGNEVSIQDLNFLKIDEFLSATLTSQVIGITAMTTTIKDALSLTITFRASQILNKGLSIKLGGVHPTIFANKLKNDYHWVDIIAGEFLDKNLDNLPFLGYHLLPVERYKPHPPHGKYKPWLPMITSRGCPYSCSYCSKAVFGTEYRFQTADRVIEEIKYLQSRFGVKEITFYDDVFTLNRNRTWLLCEKMLEQNLNLHWTCETRVNLVDKQLLELMKKAGCFAIFYGLESGNQKILDSICKKTTVEQNEYAVRLTKQVGIETIGYFMIGSPNETQQTINDTITFAKKIPLDYAQFAITTPLPGSELYEIWQKTYNKDVDWNDFRYEGSQNSPVFESQDLSRKDLESFRSKAYREFYIRPSYMWNKLLGLRNFNDFRMIFDGLNMLVKRG